MALTNLEVVSVPVSDQDRAKSFYAGKLGFSVEMDSSFGDGGMRWVMLRPPGSGTAITLVTWFETMPAGSLKGSVLGCDDLEKTLAELTAGRHLRRGRYPGGAVGPLEDLRRPGRQRLGPPAEQPRLPRLEARRRLASSTSSHSLLLHKTA
jgi:catechol 2,3-dioxygenase-like lactoylglutathione lyase family enzyme